MSEQPQDRPVGRWSRIGGPLVLLLAAASFGVVAVSVLIPSDAERELASFAPTAEQPDPSTRIPGIVVTPVADHDHAAAATGSTADGRAVPPVGGPHGPGYAACDGVAHPDPIPDTDAVHAMERGAVWITYDPARTAPNTVQALTVTRVTDADFLFMSPFPGLDSPISLQAWGHRLTLDTPDDPRFEQFIRALSDNPYTTPLPDAGCAPGT
ncbi:hypothetical protein GCM10017691_19770 [Pseudonocardia petroleophila]|uniref:DUF3105 domain-containing protein n=1 Tax=Pseudonocardia petroleophila TaxID=37331 RepID=A0A7G7MGV5_9PSEU|nr:DUF3105 domain-containing protein [Pseudonocardia petroleophila]QNG52016.1 DUF3105 domain-containing protein [Pseudonocardia petroleophila]